MQNAPEPRMSERMEVEQIRGEMCGDCGVVQSRGGKVLEQI